MRGVISSRSGNAKGLAATLLAAGFGLLGLLAGAVLGLAAAQAMFEGGQIVLVMVVRAMNSGRQHTGWGAGSQTSDRLVAPQEEFSRDGRPAFAS